MNSNRWTREVILTLKTISEGYEGMKGCSYLKGKKRLKGVKE